MPKLLTMIGEIQDISEEKQPDIKAFVKASEFVLGFAPDRSHALVFKSLDKSIESILHKTTEIQLALERSFFGELYVDRPEREQIESDLPGQRLVLTTGLVGTGKTVMLMKVCENMRAMGAKVGYFDLKANSELLRGVPAAQIQEKLRVLVYESLLAEYVNESNITEAWNQYRLTSDPNIALLRDIFRDINLQSTVSEQQVNDFLNHPTVAERMKSITPSLDKLIKFLSQKSPVILFFDNVDRYPFEIQRHVLETSIDLSNDAEIPVILAIRDANLRRITPSGANGDIVFVEEMKGKGRSAKHLQLRDFKSVANKVAGEWRGDTSIAELLSYRLNFIRQHDEILRLDDYFKYLNDKHALGLTPQEYTIRFWDVFNIISQTFVDGHVYSYCNYSIRKILVMYFDFINKLLLDPDPGYSLDSILTHDKHVRVTKLRNYFYKWLICSGEPMPLADRKILNIFEPFQTSTGPYNLTNKLLLYLYYRQAFEPAKAVTLDEIESDFERSGLKKEGIGTRLLELTKDQDFEEETLIWREDPESKAAVGNTSFILMPAGKYFMEKLEISREYVFWNACDTEIPDTLLTQISGGKPITYQETFNDEIKLHTVYEFVRVILYPLLTEELKKISKDSDGTTVRDLSVLEQYWENFSLHGHSYEVNLLRSVKGTIDHSFLDRNVRDIYHSRYQNLIKEIEKTERTYGLRS